VKAANVVVVTGARGIAAAIAGCHGASRLSVAPKYQKCLCRSGIKTLENPKQDVEPVLAPSHRPDSATLTGLAPDDRESGPRGPRSGTDAGFRPAMRARISAGA
jgi:hypothetical protein